MKKFDWNAFGKERNKIAVHCKTEEEAIDFCKQSHEHGYDWANGENRAHNTHWSGHKGGYGNETCYSYDSYCDVNWYKRDGYTILPWSDYMDKSKPIFTKSDFKDGDMTLRRNGVVEVALPSLGVFISVEGYMFLSGTKEDFAHEDGDKEWDIVEVRRPQHPHECQFNCFNFNSGELMYSEDSDVEEMTLEEICEALGKKIKIVEGQKSD